MLHRSSSLCYRKSAIRWPKAVILAADDEQSESWPLFVLLPLVCLSVRPRPNPLLHRWNTRFLLAEAVLLLLFLQNCRYYVLHFRVPLRFYNLRRSMSRIDGTVQRAKRSIGDSPLEVQGTFETIVPLRRGRNRSWTVDNLASIVRKSPTGADIRRTLNQNAFQSSTWEKSSVSLLQKTEKCMYVYIIHNNYIFQIRWVALTHNRSDKSMNKETASNYYRRFKNGVFFCTNVHVQDVQNPQDRRHRIFRGSLRET